MNKLVTLGLVVLLLAGGCGKKVAPQPDTSKPLQLVGLKYEKAVNVLQLHFSILGGVGDVGYQIDRSEVDPGCGCPAFWRRHFDQQPLPNQKGKLLQHNLKLRMDRPFAFRIRAVDSLGNLGEWSATIIAKSDKVNL